jgi:hypothetical protein
MHCLHISSVSIALRVKAASNLIESTGSKACLTIILIWVKNNSTEPAFCKRKRFKIKNLRWLYSYKKYSAVLMFLCGYRAAIIKTELLATPQGKGKVN